MSKMSDAYIRCEDLGIDPGSPDALEMLDYAVTPAERLEIFGREFPRTEVREGQTRMWNGTSDLVFTVGKRYGDWRRVKYTFGSEALAGGGELFAATHVVALPSRIAS